MQPAQKYMYSQLQIHTNANTERQKLEDNGIGINYIFQWQGVHLMQPARNIDIGILQYDLMYASKLVS